MNRLRSTVPAIACLLALLMLAGAVPQAEAFEGPTDDSAFGESSGKGSIDYDLRTSRITQDPVGSAAGRGFNPRGTVATAFYQGCSDPDWAADRPAVCDPSYSDDGGGSADPTSTPVPTSTSTPTPTPSPTPDLGEIEREAFKRAQAEAEAWLNQQKPVGVNTAPPLRSQVVHLENFMWLVGPWEAVDFFDDKGAEEVWVNVSVKPVSSLWHLEETGTGRTFDYHCTRNGHEYPGDPDVASKCGHTFDHSSSVVKDVILSAGIVYELRVTSSLTEAGDSRSNFGHSELVEPFPPGEGDTVSFANSTDAVSKPIEFPLWVNEVLTWGVQEAGLLSAPDYDTGPYIPGDDGYSCGIGENIAFYAATGVVGGVVLNAFGVGCGDVKEVLAVLAKGLKACAGGVFNSIGETVELLAGAITDPVGTVKDGVAGIKALITMAQEDPGGFVKTVGLGALHIDEEKWDAAVAANDTEEMILLAVGGLCGLATEIILGKAATKILDLIPTPGRRPGGDTTPGDTTPGDGPRRPRVCLLSSFPTGTAVRMASGELLPIEQVKPGDHVLAADPATGQWSMQAVLDQWSYLDTDYMTTVTLTDGSTVTATDHHLFWVESEQDWIELQYVAPGDHLLTPEGVTRVAEVVTHPRAATLVWELDAAGPDTFTVNTGTVDLLVHNAKRCELSDAETKHILDGDADGGFHFREGGVDPKGSSYLGDRSLRIKADNPWKQLDPADRPYKGDVDVHGTVKTSTFFPDSWSRSRVIEAIETALPDKQLVKTTDRGREYIGMSADGFPIRIIEDLDGNLVTAYPEVGRLPEA